jgi:hypothetical protein
MFTIGNIIHNATNGVLGAESLAGRLNIPLSLFCLFVLLCNANRQSDIRDETYAYSRLVFNLQNELPWCVCLERQPWCRKFFEDFMILSLVAVFHEEVEVLANQKQEKRKGRMPVGATK